LTQELSLTGLAGIEEFVALVRYGTPRERKQLALRLGTPGQLLLADAFQEVAGDKYRLLFFGDPSSEGSIEEINQWLTTHKGAKWEDEKKDLVAKAINHIRRKFDAKLIFMNGKNEVPCTLCTDNQHGGGRRFNLKNTGQPQRSIKTSVRLPDLHIG